MPKFDNFILHLQLNVILLKLKLPYLKMHCRLESFRQSWSSTSEEKDCSTERRDGGNGWVCINV